MTQATFPKLLSSRIAFDIARTILDGFDHHYALFRQASRMARTHFETRGWAAGEVEDVFPYPQQIRFHSEPIPSGAAAPASHHQETLHNE